MSTTEQRLAANRANALGSTAPLHGPRARPRRWPLRQALPDADARRPADPRRLGSGSAAGTAAARPDGDRREPLRPRLDGHHQPAAGRAWHEVIAEPTFADAILDRLVHNAYRLALDGPSLRPDAALHWRGRLLAATMAVTFVGLEAHNAFALIERALSGRELVQRTASAASDALAAARDRLNQAEAAFAAASESPRLTAAIAAKSLVDRASAEKAAACDCAANCREILSKQVAAAAAEIRDAQAEIGRRREEAAQAVDSARAAVTAARTPTHTGTAMASATGIPAWLADLGGSLLFALPLTLASVVLFVFAAHVSPARAMQPVVRAIKAQEHGRGFYDASMVRRPRTRASVDAVEGAYHAWCDANGVQPLPHDEICRQLEAVFVVEGVRGARDRTGRPYLVGIAVQPLQIEGRP